jgi:hypothetical protein
MDQGQIASGFLSRFLIIEYKGIRPKRNRQFNIPLPDNLKQKFADLATIAITVQRNNTCCQIEQTLEAQNLLDEFDNKADGLINKGGAIAEIWNRTHVKALKLAGVIAVGVNPHNPRINAEIASWAIDMVTTDSEALQKRFITGDVGTGDSKQAHDVKNAIEKYFTKPPTAVKNNEKIMKLHKAGIVPYAFLSNQTLGLASFRNGKLDSATSLKRNLQTLVDSGMLKEHKANTLVTGYGYSGVGYSIESHWK